ncbi:flagellar hook-length control protein FliK [Donghicola sp. XS_ASV15]|uniref:flagellar hook-length control protein FliK n=1 Tax=Donghicola sp. XS_ASV15 TaxID=3241295 RepID=UPI00351517CB
MTPLTLAEQSFLKIDTPQQVKPAEAKSGSANVFGNVMAHARDSADQETTEDVASAQADSKTATTPDKSQKSANSTEAPKPDVQKPTLTGEARQEAKAEIPLMARVPEGGLTTKAAPKNAEAQDKPEGAKAIKLAETVGERTETVASLQTKELTKTVKADKNAPELAAETTDVDPQKIAASEGVQTDASASPEMRERLQALSATTSAAALNVQAAVPAAETTPNEKPAATLAALSLRAQMGEKPAKATSALTAQDSQKASVEVTSTQNESSDVLGFGKGQSSTEKVENAATAGFSKGAGKDAKTAITPVGKADVVDPTLSKKEGETLTPEAQENAQTLAVATAGAAVSAPVTPRTTDKPATGLKSTQPVNAAPQSSARRTEQGAPTTQARLPEQAARDSANLQTRAGDAPTSVVEKPAATGEKPDFALKMENLIQQAATKDTTPETLDISATFTEVAQPAQPLPQTAIAAPQVQVVASPESFQQVEAAVKTAVAQELAMDEATWPETMVQDIGFETLADGEAMEIQLTPENLGRVQLRMELRDGAASVTIVTETSEAAKQFNDNQQKLADLLAKQGVELANHNAGTGRDMGRGGSDGQNGNGSTSSLQNDTADGTGQTEVATARKDPNRLVDVQA